MEAKINAIHFDITEKLTGFINKENRQAGRRFGGNHRRGSVIEGCQTGNLHEQNTSLRDALPSPVAGSLRIKDRRHIREEAVDLCIAALGPSSKIQKTRSKGCLVRIFSLNQPTYSKIP